MTARMLDLLARWAAALVLVVAAVRAAAGVIEAFAPVVAALR